MQLVFLVTDGIIGGGAGERERIRRMMAEAADAGVLIVLVVVDRAGAKSEESISSMQSVRFEGGKLIRSSYLDDYPFPYYILMRDAAQLPDVLADALRQWFQLAAQR